MALPDASMVSGRVSFRPSRYDGGGMQYLQFRAWLDGIAEDKPGIANIDYEEIRRHLCTDAAHVHGGLLALLAARCEERLIASRAYRSAPSSALRHASRP
jgi:hypothetical protein